MFSPCAMRATMQIRYRREGFFSSSLGRRMSRISRGTHAVFMHRVHSGFHFFYSSVASVAFLFFVQYREWCVRIRALSFFSIDRVVLVPLRSANARLCFGLFFFSFSHRPRCANPEDASERRLFSVGRVFFSSRTLGIFATPWVTAFFMSALLFVRIPFFFLPSVSHRMP